MLDPPPTIYEIDTMLVYTFFGTVLLAANTILDSYWKVNISSTCFITPRIFSNSHIVEWVNRIIFYILLKPIYQCFLHVSMDSFTLQKKKLKRIWFLSYDAIQNKRKSNHKTTTCESISNISKDNGSFFYFKSDTTQTRTTLTTKDQRSFSTLISKSNLLW